eukprot:87269_1
MQNCSTKNPFCKAMSLFAVLLISTTLISCLVYRWYNTHKKPLRIPQKNEKLSTPSNAYDIIIVGAGPSGSTSAYYLSKQGYKVALLERKKFPRDKYCGDAWCAPALNILEEMGILKELEDKNLCHSVQHGGFISPFGYACINKEGTTTYGSTKQIRTYAIKRIICDEYIAKKAKQTGSFLIENMDVNNAILNKDTKLWTVTTKTNDTYISRILIIADGSQSYLGKKLGIIDGESMGICSRHYIVGGTHNCKMDGVMFYTHSILPGYSAIFRHYNDDLYLGTYILPGGNATERDIPKLEKIMIEKHPIIKQYFGDKYKWKDTLKIAPLRLFGYSENGNKSYDEQVIVIGDAAAMIDPLTGEGIHTAMIGAKIAAETVDEMFKCNNFDMGACKVYHDRWMRAFGNDFYWSLMMAKLIIKFPILLDAMSYAGIQMGQSFLDEFGMIMTGVKDKICFLYPFNSIPIAVALIKEIISQKILGNKPKFEDFGKTIVFKRRAKTKKKMC